MRQLIRNVLVVNGDGTSEPEEGDVLIEHDTVTRIREVPASQASGADRVIDGNGRVLAPGFVDMHNHGALAGTRIGASGIPVACELSLRAGVTKRICGVDGLSPAPVVPQQRIEYAAQLATMDGTIDEDWSWSSMADFLAWHGGRSITDMGMYLGHNSVRRAVMGNSPGKATDLQIQEMAEVVRREAPLTLGLSTGLVYNPAVYSDSRELTALVRAFNDIKPAALLPHLRSESDQILESMDEVISAAVDGGSSYCNEHSKIAGRRNWDKFNSVESKLADAGTSVTTVENMYPYPAGSTTGDTIFPPEIRADSRQAFLARLRDPGVRRQAYERIRGDTKTWNNFIDFCGGLEGVQLAGVRPGVGDRFLGSHLGDVARAAGHEDLTSFGAFEAVTDFFVQNRGEVSIITHFGNDATVERFFRRPTMAICTDGLIPGPGQRPHPRSLGAFPRALRMARELGVPLKEIVFRMSTLPCEFLRLGSPVLRPGADASIVLFDWDTVGERNDFTDPLTPPAGIDAVWVHGYLAHESGLLNVPHRFPGRILMSAAGESSAAPSPSLKR